MTDPDGESDVEVGTAVVVALAVILVVVQIGVVAFATGFGPFGPGESGPEPATTGSGGGGTGGSGAGGGSGSGSGSGDGSAGPSEPPPYDFDVLRTEQCGNTCRDVTVRLTNNRNETAENVVVHTTIYAGNTTNGGSQIWEGRREVGTLEAGGSTTATERVSLSYLEALSVKRKGGWITIVTTVESAEVKKTFRSRRDVA